MIIHYVDIGAANGTRESAWDRYKDCLRYTFFEPDPLAATDLRNNAFQNTVVIEEALGSSNRKTILNICKKRELSSIFEPDQELLGRFPEKSRWEIVERLEIDLSTLDSHLPTIGPVDFLKIDTQGSELDILKGADSALIDVLAIKVEVEFLPLYRDQPLFGDVSHHLFSRGFELWDFTTIYRYGRNKLDRLGQVVFADALFFRPPEYILDNYDQLTSLSKLHKLSIISEIFEKDDVRGFCQEKMKP
jgi:FkbM family methyltransferase